MQNEHDLIDHEEINPRLALVLLAAALWCLHRILSRSSLTQRLQTPLYASRPRVCRASEELVRGQPERSSLEAQAGSKITAYKPIGWQLVQEIVLQKDGRIAKNESHCASPPRNTKFQTIA